MASRDFIKGECRRCAGHLEFPIEAIGQTVPCPHCGQPTELTAADPPGQTWGSRRVWLGMAVVAVLVATVAAGAFLTRRAAHHCGVSAPKPSTIAQSNTPTTSTTAPVVSSEPPVQEQTNDFAILPFKLEPTPGSSLVYITGTVRNLSNRQRFGVKLEFGLLDTNNQPIGTATDYQSVLEPHADWHFKALVMASKVASAQFNSITEEK